jgi:hypothetical protein
MILSGIAVHMIRFRIAFWKGKMLWGILIMIVAMFLTLFVAVEVTVYYVFYCLIGFLYAFVYLFYRNSIESDHVQYLLKAMVSMGMVVAIQVLILYLRSDDVRTMILNGNINIGWGLTNYVASYLIMFVPPTLYFARQAKWGIIWLFVGLFEMIMVLFTGSRGGILTMAAIAVLLLVFLLKGKHAGKMAIQLGAGLLFLAAIVWWQWDTFSLFYDRFSIELLGDSGRFEIYQDALRIFWEHPLLGGGLFARIDGNNVYHMYHNTFLHTLATMGLVGFAGLIWQLYVQFAVLFKKINPAMIVLIISMIGAHLHGMVDNIYYMPQFMILMLIIVSVAENREGLSVLEPKPTE